MAPPRVLVLVDGTNVVRSAAWGAQYPGLPVPDLASRLVDAIASWAPGADVDVHLAFDGVGPGRRGTARVTIESSGARDADELLERAAAQARAAGRPHWLVSADRAVQQVAGAHADKLIPPEAFVAELAGGPDPEPAPAPAQETGTPGASRLGDAMDAGTRSALERLRRGEA